MKGFAKYRGLMVAITLFLLVIASVTGVNFFIAQQLDQDAISVNLSGRQRMLSQRIAKTIFQIQDLTRRSADASELRKELDGAVRLFDTTLNGFRSGGEVTGGAGNQLILRRAEVGREEIDAATAIWAEYQGLLQPVLTSARLNPDALATVAGFAAENNVKILTLMNSLTTALERQSTARAAKLRWIQVAAISAALLLFAYIAFFSLRNLRRADAAVSAAKDETDNILNTVSDGLFLIDRQMIIGSQLSKSLSQIFGTKELAGKNLLQVLAAVVPDATLQTAKSFIDLLFGERVKEALMGEVNPLREVEVNTVVDGANQTKYLSFQFRRVLTDDKLTHLLVSAADVTNEIELRRELESVRKRNEAQVTLLAKMMHVGANELSQFMDKTQRGLDQMNDVLATGGISRHENMNKVAQLFRVVHTIKGDAAALGFDPIEAWAHRFEDRINDLRKQDAISGNDLLPLTVAMRELYGQISSVRDLTEKMGQVRSALAPAAATDSRAQAPVWSKAQLLAEKVAEREGKKVKVIVRKEAGVFFPPAHFHEVSDALVQLVRNAVVHGIELPQARAASGKPLVGEITITLGHGANGCYEASVQDDGAGLDFDAIRSRAVKSGLLTESDAATASREVLVKLLFSSGFSTATKVSEDAGRGVGLDVIDQSVKRLGGRVSISSRPGLGARFTLVVPERVAEAVS